MTGFPTRPDDVTTNWLGAQLRNHHQTTDIEVSDMWWEPIGTGQVGDSVRFHLGYSSTETGPPTLAAKFSAEDQVSRSTAALMGLYAKEVNFYRFVAWHLDVRLPQVLVAEVSEDGQEQILLFEDLGPARGGNQIAGCGVEEARSAICQAAAIHAPSWHNPDILNVDWLQRSPELSAKIAAMYPHAHSVFRERYSDLLEPEYMAICEELAAIPEYFRQAGTSPQCIVHGDFRLDNMLFDIKGGVEPIAILDWQTVSLGNAMADIGYFLGCGIGNELRQRHETALLDLYFDQMHNRGVTLDRESMWQEYRLGALHGVSTAVFSSAFVERTERGDANFLSMARGACALALQHNSIAELTETH